MTTFAAAVASRLPDGLVVAPAAVALYPRFEPELRRLAHFCPWTVQFALDIALLVLRPRSSSSSACPAVESSTRLLRPSVGCAQGG
ncbi:hypothetical protein SMICM17S_07830 [Streptomyces microflavus]